VDLDVLKKELIEQHNQLVQRIEQDTINKCKILGKLELIDKLKESDDKQKKIK
tara:strand:+ start:41 stop:199 length:159 start_codon:yes stop_codon:yes gene_type:complete